MHRTLHTPVLYRRQRLECLVGTGGAGSSVRGRGDVHTRSIETSLAPRGTHTIPCDAGCTTGLPRSDPSNNCGEKNTCSLRTSGLRPNPAGRISAPTFLGCTRCRIPSAVSIHHHLRGRAVTSWWRTIGRTPVRGRMRGRAAVLCQWSVALRESLPASQ